MSVHLRDDPDALLGGAYRSTCKSSRASSQGWNPTRLARTVGMVADVEFARPANHRPTAGINAAMVVAILRWNRLTSSSSRSPPELRLCGHPVATRGAPIPTPRRLHLAVSLRLRLVATRRPSEFAGLGDGPVHGRADE